MDAPRRPEITFDRDVYRLLLQHALSDAAQPVFAFLGGVPMPSANSLLDPALLASRADNGAQDQQQIVCVTYLHIVTRVIGPAGVLGVANIPDEIKRAIDRFKDSGVQLVGWYRSEPRSQMATNRLSLADRQLQSMLQRQYENIIGMVLYCSHQTASFELSPFRLVRSTDGQPELPQPIPFALLPPAPDADVAARALDTHITSLETVMDESKAVMEHHQQTVAAMNCAGNAQQHMRTRLAYATYGDFLNQFWAGPVASTANNLAAEMMRLRQLKHYSRVAVQTACRDKTADRSSTVNEADVAVALVSLHSSGPSVSPSAAAQASAQVLGRKRPIMLADAGAMDGLVAPQKVRRRNSTNVPNMQPALSMALATSSPVANGRTLPLPKSQSHSPSSDSVGATRLMDVTSLEPPLSPAASSVVLPNGLNALAVAAAAATMNSAIQTGTMDADAPRVTRASPPSTVASASNEGAPLQQYGLRLPGFNSLVNGVPAVAPAPAQAEAVSPLPSESGGHVE